MTHQPIINTSTLETQMYVTRKIENSEIQQKWLIDSPENNRQVKIYLESNEAETTTLDLEIIGHTDAEKQTPGGTVLNYLITVKLDKKELENFDF